ncbi:hypothetical protein MMC30_006196 [Trapelia coarctata]|nr:hypothetical protein [Trapelia coarctata]
MKLSSALLALASLLALTSAYPEGPPYEREANPEALEMKVRQIHAERQDAANVVARAIYEQRQVLRRSETYCPHWRCTPGGRCPLAWCDPQCGTNGFCQVPRATGRPATPPAPTDGLRQ